MGIQSKKMQLMVVLGLVLASTGAFAAGGAHGHDEGIPTRPILFASINLLLLLGMLLFFLRKPAKDFFASRSALIQKNLEQSQSLKQEAQLNFSEAQSRLNGIEEETRRLVAELKKDGELEKNRLIQEAQEQVKNLQQTGERILAQELRKAKEELKKETIALAAEMAETLVKQNLTPEDQRRLVSQYLGKMENLS